MNLRDTTDDKTNTIVGLTHHIQNHALSAACRGGMSRNVADLIASMADQIKEAANTLAVATEGDDR